MQQKKNAERVNDLKTLMRFTKRVRHQRVGIGLYTATVLARSTRLVPRSLTLNQAAL